MAGLTKEGLEILRQNEVIDALKDRAKPIFQDLVPAGDTVDTSDDSTLGRIIGLNSLPLADLWEAIQQVYLAYDPNSSYGVALDNLVALGGLERIPETSTTATIVVWGDRDTSLIPNVTSVRSDKGNLFDITIGVTLALDRNIGASFKLDSVDEGVEYKVEIITSNTTYTSTYTATDSDEVDDVIIALKQGLSSVSVVDATANGNTLIVESENIVNYIGVDSTNIPVYKVKGRTEVVAQELGAIIQEANTINSIATPVFGWDSVTNPFPALTGRERETDEELRIRFRESKFIRAQNIQDSLYSALINIDGVEYVAIYDNDTDAYDSTYDLPPHSFRVIVQGGLEQDIGQVVWTNKPLGISSEGNESVDIRDSQGVLQTVGYDRPIDVRVYIKIELTTTDNFPDIGADTIKANLINWFRDNLSIGNDVVYSRLYTPINMVEGHQVDALYIGRSASPAGTSNLSIAYNEVASLDSSDIEIIIA